jgi:TetR/AcrR family transcriptional repressor of nem operon
MKASHTDSPSKEKLLDAAQLLMLAKGFTATSVDEICETAGLSKGSFFHYFESKEHLGKEVLGRYWLSVQQLVKEGSFRQKRDPLQRIYGYVDFVIVMANGGLLNQGCLVGTFAQELSDTHPEIRSECAKRFDQWAKALARDLGAAKAKYAPKERFSSQSVAEHFIAVLEGSLILAKAEQDMGVVEKNLRHFKRYLKSLFGK